MTSSGLPPGLRLEDLSSSLAPLGEAVTLPAAVYTSPDVFAWEREHVFEGGWLCVGRVADLDAPGARRAVGVGRAGLLLVRDEAGALHVLANACRHRGHELLPCGAQATGGPLVCPYHGWVYELDGALRAAPGLGEQADVGEHVALPHPATLGLVPVRHALWGGFVFVNVDGRAPAFADVLGSLEGFAASHELADLVVVARCSYDLAANWKLAIENYHECWHCPAIHPELERRTPSTTGEYLADQRGAWVGGTMRFADGVESMTRSGRRLGRVLAGADPARVAYVGLFPNLLLALHPDYVLTHRVDPVDATRSVVSCEWLVPASTAAASGFDAVDAVDFWNEVNRQDWAAVESVQRGVTSPLYRRGPLGVREDDVYGFVQMMSDAYRGMSPQGVRQDRKVR